MYMYIYTCGVSVAVQDALHTNYRKFRGMDGFCETSHESLCEEYILARAQPTFRLRASSGIYM